ncbi:hypothetical protein UFOVP328_14 [uncultured Caudovirales phage]|uniref:Uncharacterized protein n=1 Tax=uncultured Caudovirales phage TaxID=2100421 RepID=A0A6J5LU29_9CAUD|nr:hypothetical protein UFOVP328_14 [uncultured Caudovirales phage]
MSHSGHSVFTQTLDNFDITDTQVKITKTQYEDWKKQFTADALLGLRYGQSFCNTFGITDNLLFFTREIDWCQKYIEDQYLERRKI